MERALRNAAGGIAYHVPNRANGRLRLFNDAQDYAAFEKILAASRRTPWNKAARLVHRAAPGQ